MIYVPLHSLFDHARPSAQPVCHHAERVVSWQEFTFEVSSLSASLRQRQESRWVLTSDDPYRFATHLLAALYAGKQVVIPPNARPGTLQSLAHAYDAVLDEAALPASCDAGVPEAIDPAQAIIDLYTSGSTGDHKRIRKTLAQLETEVSVLEVTWGAGLRQAVTISTVPHQHIYGLLFRLLWPLAAGRAFDAATCAHPDMLQERVAFFGETVLISSPANLTRLPELLDLASLEPRPLAIFSSGGPLPAAAALALRAGLGQAPIEVFGSTETGGVAWRQQGDGVDADLWTPFPCHRVGRSDAGGLLLWSPYLDSSEALEMDDGVELMPDGRFRLLGRLDRVVKIEEKRLSLPGMEARLAGHPWVEAGAVIPLSGRRQSLGAVVVLSAEGKAQLASQGRPALVKTFRQYLAAYFETVLLPRYWRFPENLPFNERGKLVHKEMVALFSEHVEGPCLPQILAEHPDRDNPGRIVLDLHVPSGLAFFEGHFPGAPILPGVVQVDWAVRLAKRYLPVAGVFSSLENLKFLAVVRPDVSLQLTLEWHAAQERLDFCYATSERRFSAGRIVFAGAE